MSFYYCCTQENNDCPKKETCMRYINAETEPHATLYKYACTEDNNRYLYIKNYEDIKKETVNDEQTEN